MITLDTLRTMDVTCHHLPGHAGEHVVFVSRADAADAIRTLLARAGRPVLRQWEADGGMWLELTPPRLSQQEMDWSRLTMTQPTGPLPTLAPLSEFASPTH